jgi:flagellum-specific ATP synthase
VSSLDWSLRATQLAKDSARPLVSGSVQSVVGLRFDVGGIDAAVGEEVWVEGVDLRAEVVAVGDGYVTCMPLGDTTGLRAGSRVVATGRESTVPVGWDLLGRVLDGLGEPMDGKGAWEGERAKLRDSGIPHPLMRQRITEPLALGVRSWDSLATLGRGQRVGVFAGSGVGKSTLMGMVARNTQADVNVVALIGERGREVREFLESDLGEEGMRRSVVVIATSDQPALVRIRAAFTASRIAEWYRDQGKDVLFMMDSLTRCCMAQREVGLSAGEPPATRGYPPSVFALLPQILERAGSGETGSITGIYTVLVDGDDHNEPISDASRSILDGHVTLTRALAHQNHYPAIDVLQSISRVMSQVTTREQRQMAGRLRELLAAWQESRDLIEIGAYKPGSNALVDEALAKRPAIERFLRQSVEEVTSYEDTWRVLEAVLA